MCRFGLHIIMYISVLNIFVLFVIKICYCVEFYQVLGIFETASTKMRKNGANALLDYKWCLPCGGRKITHERERERERES